MRLTTFFVVAASALNLAVAAPTCNAAPTLSTTAQLQLADTAVDRYAILKDDAAFLFDFNKAQEGAGEGGELIPANRKTMPALVGTGGSATFGRVKSCGINTFHIHPRAAELQVVTSGKLLTWMTPENGVLTADGKRRVIYNEVAAGQMTVFPLGSVHTQFNMGCEDASFVAFFPNEDSGTSAIVESAFAFPNENIIPVVGSQLNDDIINKVRDSLPKNLLLNVQKCMDNCKNKKRSAPLEWEEA